MKEYLRTLCGLQRIHKLLAQGSEVDYTTVVFFIEEFVEQFKLQFGGTNGSIIVLQRLEIAKTAAAAKQFSMVVRLLNESNILL